MVTSVLASEETPQLRYRQMTKREDDWIRLIE